MDYRNKYEMNYRDKYEMNYRNKYEMNYDVNKNMIYRVSESTWMILFFESFFEIIQKYLKTKKLGPNQNAVSEVWLVLLS